MIKTHQSPPSWPKGKPWQSPCRLDLSSAVPVSLELAGSGLLQAESILKQALAACGMLEGQVTEFKSQICHSRGTNLLSPAGSDHPNTWEWLLGVVVLTCAKLLE